MKSIILQTAALGIGVLIGLSLTTQAHTPCDTYEAPEQCGYELHVDPQTGNLESVYVCH